MKQRTLNTFTEYQNMAVIFNYYVFDDEDIDYEDVILDNFDSSYITRNDFLCREEIGNIYIYDEDKIGETIFSVLLANLYMQLKIDESNKGNKVLLDGEEIFVLDSNKDIIKHYRDFDFYYSYEDSEVKYFAQDPHLKRIFNQEQLCLIEDDICNGRTVNQYIDLNLTWEDMIDERIKDKELEELCV